MTLQDDTKQDIIRMLRWGKRRRSEIIETIDRSQSTIDKKLRELVDEHDDVVQIKEKGGTYYYLNSETKDVLFPLPSADDEEVESCLYMIKKWFDTLTGEDIITGDPVNERISDTDLALFMDKTIKSSLNFVEIAQNNYHVLDNKMNWNLYRGIFVTILEILDELLGEKILIEKIISEFKMHQNINKTERNIYDLYLYQKNAPLRMGKMLVVLFFYATSELIKNYDDGKEHKDLQKFLLNQKQGFRSINTQDELIQAAIMQITYPVDRNWHKEHLLNIIGNGGFDVDLMISHIFHTYEEHNELDELFKRLETIKQKVDEPTEKEIMFLENEIRRKYDLSNIPIRR